MAVSWTCTSNPARGRGWLLCTLPTLPQSQNLCVWALFMLFPVLPFHALVQTGRATSIPSSSDTSCGRAAVGDRGGGGFLGLRRLVTSGVSGMWGCVVSARAVYYLRGQRPIIVLDAVRHCIIYEGDPYAAWEWHAHPSRHESRRSVCPFPTVAKGPLGSGSAKETETEIVHRRRGRRRALWEVRDALQTPGARPLRGSPCGCGADPEARLPLPSGFLG